MSGEIECKSGAQVEIGREGELFGLYVESGDIGATATMTRDEIETLHGQILLALRDDAEERASEAIRLLRSTARCTTYRNDGGVNGNILVVVPDRLWERIARVGGEA